ncbi:MAG: hypothetical protein OCD76_06045 [Reichenbachiella sp.]
MKAVYTFLFALLIVNSSFAQSDLIKVGVVDSLGEKQIELRLLIENLTDDYVLIPKGDIKYVLKFEKDDAVQTKEENFTVGPKILDPKEKSKKEKSHLDNFIGGKGKYLAMESFESELKTVRLDVSAIKAGLKSKGYISVVKESQYVSMNDLGEIIFKTDNKKLEAKYRNGTKQKRKFTLTYNYFTLTKEGFSDNAKASTNPLQKVKPKAMGVLNSTAGGGKYEYMDDECLVQPILFKSIKTSKRGEYYSFQNGDYGKYTVEFASKPVFVSKVDGKSSDETDDFFTRSL